MAVITKKDLQFTYRWSADNGDNPNRTGSPDNHMIDRDEGYEVLHYLNALNTDKETALKAERLIRNHLPSSTRSTMKITDWLNENWDKY